MKVHKIRYIITIKIYRLHNNQFIIINQSAPRESHESKKARELTDGAICHETASRSQEGCMY